MGTNYPIIVPEAFYHICDRAVGQELMFRSSIDYSDWMNRIAKYIIPVAELHAFCLMPNHYHLLIRTQSETDHTLFSTQLSRLQSTYTKHLNHRYGRKGGLFMRPYNRRRIMNEAQLAWIFWYIHRNPMHHGYTTDWQNWPHSSYPLYFDKNPGWLTTQFCTDLFGGLDQIRKHHQMHAQALLQDMKILALE